ncbi:hypothetical protein S245_063691, partial [Arachis hypogaea]
FGTVAIVFWTQHLMVLSLASTATKAGFSAKKSKPKRTNGRKRERGQRNRSSKLRRK